MSENSEATDDAALVEVHNNNTEATDDTALVEFHNTVCNGCDTQPIFGELYNCDDCPQKYDLCGKCKSHGVHKDHTMGRVEGKVGKCTRKIT